MSSSGDGTCCLRIRPGSFARASAIPLPACSGPSSTCSGYALGLGRPRPWRRLFLLPLTAVATLPLLLVLFHVYGSAVPLPEDGRALGAALARQAASLFPLDPLASLAELGERLARVAGFVRQAPGPGDAVLPLDGGRLPLALAPIGVRSFLP